MGRGNTTIKSYFYSCQSAFKHYKALIMALLFYLLGPVGFEPTLET